MLSAEQIGTLPRLGLGQRALVGTTAAVGLVIGCFLIASWTDAALTVTVRDAVTPVPLGAAVFATAAAGGVAYLLARLAGRTARPRLTFLTVTIAGLLASVVPPLAAAIDTGTAVWLLVMHAVAAAALIPVIASGLPTARRSGGGSG